MLTTFKNISSVIQLDMKLTEQPLSFSLENKLLKRKWFHKCCCHDGEHLRQPWMSVSVWYGEILDGMTNIIGSRQPDAVQCCSWSEVIEKDLFTSVRRLKRVVSPNPTTFNTALPLGHLHYTRMASVKQVRWKFLHIYIRIESQTDICGIRRRCNWIHCT